MSEIGNIPVPYPFAEDDLGRFKIGDTVFRGVKKVLCGKNRILIVNIVYSMQSYYCGSSKW